ncbi:MAG TPA: hypothetical protein VIK18_26880 [Pirellulales bacterium]
MQPHSQTATYFPPKAAEPPPAADTQNRRRRRRLMIVAAGCALVAVLLVAGWILLATAGDSSSAGSSELTRFDGHQAAVRALAVAADGQRAVSGDQAGKLLVWNTTNRVVQGRLAADAASVNCVAISLDGKLAASGDEAGKIRVWDLEHLRQQASVVGHRGAVTSVVMYPAKTHLVSGGRDGRLVLWKLSERGADCTPAQQAALNSVEVTCLAITPDGLQVLCGDTSGAITVWNLASMQQLRRFEAHKGAVRGVAVSPLGGQAITCGDDGQVRRWDLERGRLVVSGKPAGDPVRPLAVAYSPGGTRALSADSDGQVCLWSVDDMQVISSYAGHTAAASCVVFFPSGSVALSGSLDHSIRVWQMPVPSVLEAKQTAAAIAGVQRQGERLLKFRRQMELGQQALHEERDHEALAEFRAAEASVDRGSLEFQVAHQASVALAAESQALADYEARCKAGAAALENEALDEALKQFAQARQAIAGRPEAATLHQADEGYATAARLVQLKRALDGRKITYHKFNFSEHAPAKQSLAAGQRFAFLLNSADPPMALASTPLEWTFDLQTPVAFPDEKVDFKVQLWQHGATRPLAEVRQPFAVGQTEQSFNGRAQPPEGGWQSGEYQLRVGLVLPKKEAPREPLDFKLGVLDWSEKHFELKPDELLAADYLLDAGIKLERGDGVIVKATGTMAPAPVAFYRQLLVDPKISAPVPTGPAGIRWLADGMRVHRYRLVDLKSNYAALLLRIGYEGSWLAYRDDAFPMLSPLAGPLQLAINSVLPLGHSSVHASKNLSDSERSYWAAGSGAYQVTILHGRFEFPISLSAIQRAGLLTRFSDR